MGVRPYILLLFVFLPALVLGGVPPAFAEGVKIHLEGNPPWTVSTDRVTALGEEEIYLAEGNVRVERENELITADRGRLHSSSQLVELWGHVTLTTVDFKVVCERIVLDLRNNLGKIYSGTVFFQEGHYYVSGDEIEKTGSDTFMVIKGRATSCDGPNPDWTLAGENIVIEREGFATAEHVSFSTKYFPLAYFPWLKVPIKTKRQTGFLIPGVAVSSRDGFVYSQPFFWAVNDSHDFTLTGIYRENRGFSPTLEYRYKDWGGRGLFRATYLDDQQPPNIATPQGIKTQEERYWVRAMADHDTPNGFNVKLDLDLVSDQKYLDEFKHSYAGYDDTRAAMFEEFGRELAEPLDPLRRSVLQITRAQSFQYFRFGVEYNDNLYDPKNLETLQKLPTIGLDLTRYPIEGTPLYFGSESEYTHFTRKTDDYSIQTDQGHRLDLHPRLYLPLNLAKYIEVEPSVGVRATFYYPYQASTNPAQPDTWDRTNKFKSREMIDAGLDLSSNLSRVFDIDMGRVMKLKHRVKPEVRLSYVSKVNQDDLPYWDSLDRIPEEQRVTYGLNNYLVAKLNRTPKNLKSRTPGDDTEASSLKPAEPEYEYSEFLRLGFHRSYDFVQSRRYVELRSGWQPQDLQRPHSPWSVDMELSFTPYFWALARSEYDTYEELFTDHSVEVQAQDHRGDFLYVAYNKHLDPFRRINRDEFEYEEIRTLVNFAIDGQWALQFDRRYSIMERENIETIFAINYQPQCWGLRVEYIDRPDDTAVAVFFSFKGLGDIGGSSYTRQENTSSQVYPAASAYSDN